MSYFQLSSRHLEVLSNTYKPSFGFDIFFKQCLKVQSCSCHHVLVISEFMHFFPEMPSEEKPFFTNLPDAMKGTEPKQQESTEE